MCDPNSQEQVFYAECDNVTAFSTTESPLYMGIDNTGLKLWQLLLMAGGSLSFVIIFCCCVRFRIPRTKQEIEADYIRKKITRKFQKQLRMIQDTEMDEMDLKKALDRVRAEFKTDIESIAHTEGYSGGSLSSAAGVTRMAAAENAAAVAAESAAAAAAATDQAAAAASSPLQSHIEITVEEVDDSARRGLTARLAAVVVRSLGVFKSRANTKEKTPSTAETPTDHC